jgi:hypothetical protein
MTNINPAAQAAQDAARTAGGQFGVQQHSAPEVTLDAHPHKPRFDSDHLNALRKKEAELIRQQKELADVIVEEHIIDAARDLPVEVRKVFYRVDPDNENGPKMLMFESAEDADGNDVEDLDPALRSFAYEVGWSFGQGNDLDYRNWVDEHGDDSVSLDFDEHEADRLIEKYQADIDQDMAEHGIVNPQLRRGKDVWLERSIRMRAADAGISHVHLRFSEDGPSALEVVHFEDTRGAHRRPNGDDPDDAFILGRVRGFGYRSDGMRPAGNDRPDAAFTLDVR